MTQFAIDGKIATGNNLFFHSSTEDYPWLQIKVTGPQEVSVLKIVNRHGCCGNKLQNVEIRAGLNPVTSGFKGLLTQNEKVGFFTGPGVDGGTYNITFEARLTALYVTLQIIDRDSILQVNEATVTDEGKSLTSHYGVSSGSYSLLFFIRSSKKF